MKQFGGVLLLLIIGHLTTAGQTAKLTGVVYDANGAVIVGASVTATDAKKKSWDSRTNGNGEYEIDLPFNNYDPSSKDFGARKFKIMTYQIVVEADHFQQSIVSNFKIVPAFTGEMKLDFALDVAVISDPVIFDKSN